VPARIIAQGIGLSGSTPGGLITSAGPLRGTYFGANTAGANTPSINRLNFGAISGQWMQGGDYLITRDQHNGSSTLIPEEDRRNAFGRLSWKFSDALEVYGQASYSRYEGVSYYQKTYSTGVTIQRDNAYLPQAIRNSMVASNLSTIAVGFGNEGIPAQGSANKREVYRFLVGGNGEFELAGRDVKWDAYAQEGIVKADELLVNTYQTQYLARATDAVVVTAANVGNSGKSIGSIACRFSLSNPGDACVPINRFGLGNVTPEALNYIFNNGNQPLREQTLKQRVGGLTFSANNIFELPAGPVSLAFGAEVRKESITGTVDPQFSVDQSGPFRGVTKWIYGNYFPTIGSFDVKEAFVEAIVPVFKGFDVNGAFRATDYSTSGRVNTWKVGGTWQAIQDVKFRGTISRDIRAPNLQELFSIVGRSNAITVPAVGGLAAPRSDNFFENTVGNLDLRPEVAKTYGGGIVLTPTFLEGFAASVDYYKIKLSGAISAISAQTAVTLCYEQNLPQYCSGIQTANGLAAGPGNVSSPITGITLQSINFVAIKTRGLDFEASYRKMIGEGQVTLRALATHYISLYTNNGIDVPTEAAGQNAGNVPDWSFRLSANYEQGPFGFQIVGRGISSGKYDNSFIECTSGCPVSTVANRTINNNRIDGAWYVDVQSNYRFDVGPTRMQAFINIRNLLNEDPVLVANGPTGNNTPAYPQTNRVLYDVQGRIYRLGLRVAI
jgi:iron complex outermembrane receptor protein